MKFISNALPLLVVLSLGLCHNSYGGVIGIPNSLLENLKISNEDVPPEAPVIVEEEEKEEQKQELTFEANVNVQEMVELPQPQPENILEESRAAGKFWIQNTLTIL